MKMDKGFALLKDERYESGCRNGDVIQNYILAGADILNEII